MRLLLVARLTGTADRQIRIEAEDQEARDWAERRGHQIIAVAADRKWRAKGMWERPNLRSWVTDPAKIAKYDGIVAAKQDRLSRARWRDEIEIRWWAEEHGRELFIVSPELHWPPRSIAEQVTWELEAARSRAEREIISSRHQRTHPYVSDRGYLVGGPPFGALIDEDSTDPTDAAQLSLTSQSVQSAAQPSRGPAAGAPPAMPAPAKPATSAAPHSSSPIPGTATSHEFH